MDIRFPCETLPEGAAGKLLGVHPQRQPGLCFQRVRIPGGRLAVCQLKALAELAREYTPGWPLHLTTRQDIELHGIPRHAVPAVQKGLAAAGLTGLSSGGDSLRNIAMCPGNGLCPGSRDLARLADAVRCATDSLPWVRQLPRKFKMSLSGCGKACGRPWINDLGLVAGEDGRFKAVVGGSLGPKPGVGLLLPGTYSVAEVVPLAVAALRLFHAEGDRTNRARERMGDEAFKRKLQALFEEEVAEGQWSAPELPPVSTAVKPQARLRPPLGDLTPQEALDLANAVEISTAELRIGFEHDLLLFGESAPRLSGSLQRFTQGPSVVACPGAAWCSRGIADSRALAEALRASLPSEFPFGIAISGCPNGCSHSAVADIGLTGRPQTINGRRVECYRLVVGGERGQGPAFARELHPGVPVPEVPGLLKWVALEFKRRQRSDEPFAAFVAREWDRLLAKTAEML